MPSTRPSPRKETIVPSRDTRQLAGTYSEKPVESVYSRQPARTPGRWFPGAGVTSPAGGAVIGSAGAPVLPAEGSPVGAVWVWVCVEVAAGPLPGWSLPDP